MPTNKSLAELLLEYAMWTGARKINQLPGLWINQLDEQWLLKCNGHAEEIEGIPPFSWAIEFNGWPAGILSIHGEGILCAGEAANELSLIAALENKMQSA